MSDGRHILLAWEMGAGLGHARRLLPIATALASRGFRPVVAARDPASALGDYRKAGVPILQAPTHRGFVARPGPFRAQTYADIMAACAWDDVDALDATVSAWDALIELLDPALVVADYCPMLPLATVARRPLVVMGDGFVVPPPDAARMPLLRQLDTPPADESILLRNGSEVLARRGVGPLASLPRLIGGDRHIVCTFPALDIYGRLRAHPASGPMARMARLPAAEGGGLFVYLAADHADTAKCLQAVIDSGLPARAFVRDAGDRLKAVLRQNRMVVHDTPPSLTDELRDASCILHHGGIGTAEAALAAGRSQILLPRHFEQTLNARCLVAAGVAASLPGTATLPDMTSMIREAVASPGMAAGASALAASLENQPAETSLDVILKACGDLL